VSVIIIGWAVRMDVSDKAALIINIFLNMRSLLFGQNKNKVNEDIEKELAFNI